MGNENTNWGQSVTAVVIRENKVLLARHTYGGGKGMLIIPGGYVNIGETPQDALVREYIEEKLNRSILLALDLICMIGILLFELNIFRAKQVLTTMKTVKFYG